ncbi:MAG: hypothetical protein ACRCZG_02525, partial [Culicoidibacterales bacterium]
MPDEVITSLTDVPAVTPPAPPADWTPPTREEYEALNGKYEKAQKDLGKFRTRAEEVEAAKKAQVELELKNKPLEEQLEAERLKR